MMRLNKILILLFVIFLGCFQNVYADESESKDR